MAHHLLGGGDAQGSDPPAGLNPLPIACAKRGAWLTKCGQGVATSRHVDEFGAMVQGRGGGAAK